MSTTALSVAWFAQPSCSHSITKEFRLQLNENAFDGSTMLIDGASISQQSLKRFKNLRAVEVNGQVLFPASHFDDADDFGWQFLSHAVYESLLDGHIADLQSKSSKTFMLGVLGEIQNQFYFESWPEYFFYDVAEWDARKRQTQIEEFRIERPSKKVCDYVVNQKRKTIQKISTGNRVPTKARDPLSQADSSTYVTESLVTDDVDFLFQRLTELLTEITDKKLAVDFLDFKNALGVVLKCSGVAVTPDHYQEFMEDWNDAPQPIRGATWIQGLLWKWLYVRLPYERSKYFHGENESDSVKHKISMARSRRLENLNEFLKSAVMRASS
jgi:hypothetical protein